MNTAGRWIIRREELNRYHREISRENRNSFQLLSVWGLVLSVFNYLAQLVVAGEGMPLFRSGLLSAYFALLIFIDRCLLAEEKPLATSRLYLAQAPVMVLAILLGTVWDPGHQASTLMMFLLFLPVFVMDSPLRFDLIQGAWTLLFAGLCLAVKKPPILGYDLIHALEYYVASCAVMYVVSIIRLLSLRRREKMQHNLTHDPDTGCWNLVALEERQEEYFGQEQLILFAGLNRLTMINDFYGAATANAAVAALAGAVTDLFGEEHVYVKNGKEVLCIIPDPDPDDCLEKLGQCRLVMHSFEFRGKRIPMTSAFGYVTGKPDGRERFRQMTQLAEICLHQAEGAGSDQVRGKVFTPETFVAAAAESNNSAAQSYEINPLTGLPRLHYFTARAGELLKNAVDVSRHPVIGFIRLTRMREYNDTLGYARGDELIRETARLLRVAFYSRVLCHITAGQFCVLCYREQAEPGILQLCEGLKEYAQGAPVECKAGFAEYTGSEQVITLIDRARLAQKSILSFRDQQMCFYDSVLDNELRFRQHIISHLDEAIEKNYLVLFFQPIIRASTGEICSEEALSRWDDPEMGLLMPYRFIPPLEENGLMYKVNLHAVDLVLANFRQRLQDGVPIVPVSVNLSRKDFSQCDMVREITERVDRSGFSRDLIRIEITESAFIADQELLRHEIERFRKNGFKVWLDDFGSEYSTLNLLEDVDFDLIKIDMKFMRNFTGSGKNHIIVSHMIRMASEMGMVTLMEGVETEEHYRAMQELRCDLVQGYYFDRPNPYRYLVDTTNDGTGIPFEQYELSPGSIPEAGKKERSDE